MPIPGSYQVTMNDESAGTLDVIQQGRSYTFEFVGDKHFDVSRLICVGTSSAASIGIPAPRGDGMYLRKNISLRSLHDVGLDSIHRCLIVPVDADISSFAVKTDSESTETSSPEGAVASEAENKPSPNNSEDSVNPPSQRPPPTGGWQGIDDPASLFSDPCLQGEAAGISGALISIVGNDSCLLALPYSPSSPFPLVSCFRSASTRNIGRRKYIIFNIQNGVVV